MNAAPPRRRALIVDDETSVARLCGRVLSALGARADEAGTFAQAAALIAAADYDLLVCDMRLPDGCGMDLAAEFRRRNPGGRIIVMTGSLTPGHPALTECCAAVLTKPFELQELRAAAAAALSGAGGAA